MEEKKIDDLSAFFAPLTLTNPPLRCVVEHICEAVGKQQ